MWWHERNEMARGGSDGDGGHGDGEGAARAEKGLWPSEKYEWQL